MSEIKWRIHLSSTPENVYKLISTDNGRAKFWAEKALEVNGNIHFQFINGQLYVARIIEKIPSSYFELEYFDSVVKFLIEINTNGGTDLTLINIGVSNSEYSNTLAGWVSVLMSLKGAADFDIDLRNHDPLRTWDQMYADN